jgi:predicted metal-dependent phosphoesterase TrpH
MLDLGYVASVKEAFTKYLGRDAPAYVAWEKMTPVRTVELIVRTNGLPVLAHPLTVNDLEAMVVELKAVGLVGIEAYYNGYTVEQVSQLVSLARRHRLIATGGSDYHGLYPGTETTIGGSDVPVEAAERLIALAEQQALKLANPPI